MRLVKGIGILVVALLLLANIPAVSPSRAAGMCPAGNYHFWGLVTRGMDAGTVVESILAVTAGTTPTLTMGDGTSISTNCSMTGSSISLQASMATMGNLAGTGATSGKSWIGSFTGPHTGDAGTWWARPAPTSINFAVTGNVKSGPNKGMNVIGDLSGIVTADGTLFGTYHDNSNVGPGIVTKTYPVHGWYINNNLSAAILWNKTAAIFISGHAGTFFGLQSLNGTLNGPKSGDSGAVSAVAQ